MRITNLKIKNYRSLKNIELYPESILALVGKNNSGKSNILMALKFFFESSIKLVSEESFHNHCIEEPIEICTTFEDLTEWEREKFQSYLNYDKLIIKKVITCDEDGSITIDNYAIISVPENEWLQQELINGEQINEWWNEKDQIEKELPEFLKLLGSKKPKVSDWKEKAATYVNNNQTSLSFVKKEFLNPSGYSGVLKGYLPDFIYIPAVRDVLEETKITQSNPFGTLINAMLEQISSEKIKEFSQEIQNLSRKLNRNGGGNRFPEIKQLEDDLNSFMTELIDCDIELKIDLPLVEDLFRSAKILVFDGIKTSLEKKGHGLQRSMIFTILRVYAEHLKRMKAQERAREKSIIFAIEEPELYLHPQMQRTLVDVLLNIADNNNQIFYSTQSSLFIDISRCNQICILRRQEVDSSWQSTTSMVPIPKIIEEMKTKTGKDYSEIKFRELFSNVFNPTINEGFFSDKIVIVEGPSEEYSLPIYAEMMGFDFDRNNITIASAGSKNHIERLLIIFQMFNIPTYLIFDGDKDKPGSPQIKKTMQLLEILGESETKEECVETRISGEFAIFEMNYDELLKNEISNFNELKREAKKTLGTESKSLLHRYIANNLKKKIENGEKKDILPKSIIEIVKKIMNL